MRKLTVLLLLFVVTRLAAADAPNFILIYADDLGYLPHSAGHDPIH